MRLLLVTITICIGLAGCGQSGPLYIPQDEPVAAPAADLATEPTDPAVPTNQ